LENYYYYYFNISKLASSRLGDLGQDNFKWGSV